MVFCQQLFERIDFEVALGQQPLEPGLFLLQLTEALGFRDAHPPELLAPAIEGGLGDAMCTANGADHLLTAFGLLHNLDDLFRRKLACLH